MSSNIKRRTREPRDLPRSRSARYNRDFVYRRPHLEAFYDEEEDYHFAETNEDEDISFSEFGILDNVELDTIDDMSSALNESQRKAVRWRILTLRGIAVFNVILLLAACLPCWILMLEWNTRSIKAEKRAANCAGIDEPFRLDPNCVFYRHELSTFTAVVGLWLIGTLLQSLFMIFTAWRLHSKSFQAVISVWMCVFIVVAVVVVVYSVTVLTLMTEPFNWRKASLKFEVLTFVPTSHKVWRKILPATIGCAIVLLLTQSIWLWIMHQVLQYGLNLKEFGSEICGDSADIAQAAEENAHAAHSAIGRLLGDDEYSRYHDDINDEEFSDLGESDENMDAHQNRSNGSDPSTLSAVVEMMTTLTSTMAALNQKIDAIESRVGDGSALLVMPPGENQWDARKPGQT